MHVACFLLYALMSIAGSGLAKSSSNSSVSESNRSYKHMHVCVCVCRDYVMSMMTIPQFESTFAVLSMKKTRLEQKLLIIVLYSSNFSDI